jgi:hypothetical protein
MDLTNSFEFKVVTDQDGKNVSLGDMPIGAAKAFLTFYQALVKLAELSGDENPRIGIKSGSAVAIATGTTAELIQENYDLVVAGQCTNADIVKQWRDVQAQVQANGYAYEINAVSAKGVRSLKADIKKSKAFAKKPVKSKFSNSIKFISGKLTEIGANIHVTTDKGEKITIECEEERALKAIKYIFKPIWVSVWARKATNSTNASYELCDVYNDEAQYNGFKDFIEDLEKENKIAALTAIHRTIKSELAKENFGALRRLFNLWIHPTTDIQTLKIVLVITKAFKDDERIAKHIARLQECFAVQDAKHAKKLKKKKRAQ